MGKDTLNLLDDGDRDREIGVLDIDCKPSWLAERKGDSFTMVNEECEQEW